MAESLVSPVSWVDVLALIIASAACIVAIVNVAKYNKLQSRNNDLQEKYNEMVKVQMLTAQGALETQMRSTIAEAYHNLVKLGMIMMEKPENDMLQKIYSGAEEVYRNAYEDACGKYLDGKIDKERFRRMYQSEIRKLVEDEEQKTFYSSTQSIYDCTIKVYNEWNHPDRV